MIQVNELRVNDFLLKNGKPCMIGADAICQIGWNSDGLRHAHSKDKWEPIPLTPEILENVPFETLYVGSRETTYWQQHKPDIDFVLTWYVKDGRIEWKGRKIQYVHELQNLYFALAGEELDISF